MNQLTIHSNNFNEFKNSKLNPMLDINYATNWALDFNSATTLYPANKKLRRFDLFCRFSINGTYYFILNFLSLTNNELSEAIDLFHDLVSDSENKLKDDYLSLASNKGYNPNRRLDTKVSFSIKPDKISN